MLPFYKHGTPTEFPGSDGFRIECLRCRRALASSSAALPTGMTCPKPSWKLDIPALRSKVGRMETNWATEHLQVIRTLMERSAVYRRALAPVMVLTGVLGLAAALAGSLATLDSPRGFAVDWLLVGMGAV